MAGGGDKQMQNWLAGYSCVVCRWEEEGGGQWKWKLTVCTRKRYPKEQNTTNSIVMVLSENDNTSK